MEFASDQFLARALLTLNVLGFSLGPAIADFNRTHATNPLWTPHARFHVVWQVLSYVGIGVVVLGLIWTGAPDATGQLWLAVALIAAVYGAFFLTVFSMPRFGGGVTDSNGVPPIATVQFAGRARPLDTNVTVFCAQIVLLTAAMVAIGW